MNTTQAAVMEPIGEGEISLQGVAIEATLEGLLSEVTVSQTYKNHGETNIEAVYTFPLPLDAILMELTLELDGEILRGEVKPRNEAEEDYEGAIEEGDSAVLLTQVQPGLFSVNVGNLMAGEEAVVCFRYAQLHRWQGDSLRFHLPTTLAPRYGDIAASGLMEHEVPEHTLNAEYKFSFDLWIAGQLSQAEIESPSHRINQTSSEGTTGITLEAGSNLMDRDFILIIREPNGLSGEGLWAKDYEGVVALASFHPELPQPETIQPRCIKLVVDCSGSMAGDSIAQARLALREILDLLRPEDWFNLTLFGSNHRLIFNESVPADELHIQKASRVLQNLDADMGGTELGGALESTYACGAPAGIMPDVLLITDGEVWEHDELVQAAKSASHRLFTVGVGSAVTESLLRSLAESTGGACELVSPNENMVERIVRHFKRIQQPAVTHSQVQWPVEPQQQTPQEFDAIYAGDTLHLFGWLPVAPEGEARLDLELSGGIRQESIRFRQINENDERPGTLVRMAAHSQLSSLDDEAAKALAVKYQLVTAQTSCVLVKQRDEQEKADEIPELQKVPHQLAAGWGGTGQLVAFYDDLDINTCCFQEPVADYSSDSVDSEMDYLDAPAFLRKQADMPSVSVADQLNDAHSPLFARNLHVDSLRELSDYGVDQEILDSLKALVEAGYQEEMIVIAWLSLFINTEDGHDVSRHVRRLIHKAEKKMKIESVLKRRVSELLNTIDEVI